jgi:hypothetical protein
MNGRDSYKKVSRKCYDRSMAEIRKTKHAAYDLKYHFVWIPKYRKKMLRGKVAK